MARQINKIFPFILFTTLLISGINFAQDKEVQDKEELYFSVKNFNQGVADSDIQKALQTPRSTLEYFLEMGHKGNFSTASHALSLHSLPANAQSKKGSILAEQLYYVMNQKLQIDWSGIPDRPDGILDVPLDSTSPLAGKLRRSIKIGSIPLENRSVEIRLDRYKSPQNEAVWQFSQRTVDMIPLLYKKYGPGPLLQYLPPSIKNRLLYGNPLWQVATLSILMGISLLGGWICNRVVFGTLKQSSKKRIADTAKKIQGPTVLFVTLEAFDSLTFSLLSLSGPLMNNIGPLMNVMIIFSITWFVIRLTEIVTDFVSQQYIHEIEREGEGHARRVTTHISVARRVIIFIALVVTAGVALRQFHIFESLSMSLLASAGVASVILGVAAQSVLGNIMAGIQVAIDQPACIGDSVLFEGHWGFVEEITYTYITIRTWDSRRLVVPLSYFIGHPFENWSMKDAHMIKPIYLYVDYRTDVPLVRKKFEEILKSSEDWDQRVTPVVEVTSLTSETMELRALCSAKDAPTSWNLHCYVREKLIAFLQQVQEGQFLPKHRVLIEDEKPSILKASPQGA